MSSSPPQLEDVRELMQLIQLHLPIKEAARTSMLSKSWLHAWSTISTLRFCIRDVNLERARDMKVVEMVSILTRYLRDNIPIERFDLNITLRIQESVSLVENCIRTMATHKNSTTLRELSLTFSRLYMSSDSSHTLYINLPHEILSCENLTTIRVVCARGLGVSLSMTSHSHDTVIINCVSLRELYLEHVTISQELLDGILSSCKLLVKIDLLLKYSPGLSLSTIKVTNLPCLYQLNIETGSRSTLEIIKVTNLPCLYQLKIDTCLSTIKVTNLPCLYQLKIDTGSRSTLEINHLPNLRVFSWGQNPDVPFNAHSISLGSSLKELWLGNMVTSDASLDMIKYEAPLLEILTLDMEKWELGSLHFPCDSIKRLSLMHCPSKLTDIKIHASNLLSFSLDGETMPSLLFPLSTLIKETTFRLILKEPVDVSFFLKMREALAISSNCYLYINTLDIGMLSLNIKIADLRTKVLFPRAMSVQRLFFQVRCDKRVWERSSFIDALFEICHPNQVTAMRDPGYLITTNHFCKVMLTEVLQMKKTACFLRDLERVQISYNKKWETLKISHKSFLDSPTSNQVDFKLEWR